MINHSSALRGCTLFHSCPRVIDLFVDSMEANMDSTSTSRGHKASNLLTRILLLLISTQFSLYYVYIGNTHTAQAPTKTYERSPDEVLKVSLRILNHIDGYGQTSISTTMESMSRDTDTTIKLYASSASQIERGIGLLINRADSH